MSRETLCCVFKWVCQKTKMWSPWMVEPGLKFIPKESFHSILLPLYWTKHSFLFLFSYTVFYYIIFLLLETESI